VADQSGVHYIQTYVFRPMLPSEMLDLEESDYDHQMTSLLRAKFSGVKMFIV
jgi:hypothetical protein